MSSIFSVIKESSYYYEASNSCDDPPRTKRERASLFASYQKRQENVEAQLTMTSGALVTS